MHEGAAPHVAVLPGEPRTAATAAAAGIMVAVATVAMARGGAAVGRPLLTVAVLVPRKSAVCPYVYASPDVTTAPVYDCWRPMRSNQVNTV